MHDHIWYETDKLNEIYLLQSELEKVNVQT